MCLAHMCVQRQLRTSARTDSQKCSHKHPALNAHTCTHTRPHHSCVPTHPYTCALTNSAHGPVHTLTPLSPGLRLRHAPSGSHTCSSSTRGLPLPASPPLPCSVHPQLQAPPTSGPTSAEASRWGPQVNPAAPGLCAGGTRVTPNCPPEQAGPLTLSLGSSLSQHVGTAPAPSSAGARGQHHLQHWASAPGPAPGRWEWVLCTQWSPRISPPSGSRELGPWGHPSRPAQLHRPQATSLRMQVELQTAANWKRQQVGTPTGAKLNQGTYYRAEQGTLAP